jgi:hypothetical protein
MSDVRFCACVEGLLRGRKATCAGEGGGSIPCIHQKSRNARDGERNEESEQGALHC